MKPTAYSTNLQQMTFQSLGPDAYIICTRNESAAPVSPRRRQAQLTLKPIRTLGVPVDFTPTTPQVLRFRDLERHKYAGGLGLEVWQGRLRGFLVRWMCGV